MDITRRRALVLLAGGAAAMGMTPDVDQFSQFLRLAFFRSPNYQAGVAGWTVNQDGSAEFNNLTIRGTFNGNDFILNANGMFFYAATPATGNLVASITRAAGNDGLAGGGNAYLAGLTNYSISGGTFFAVNMGWFGLVGTSVPQLGFYTAPAAGGPWTLKANAQSNAGGDLVLNAGSGALINLDSQVQATSTVAFNNVAAPVAPALPTAFGASGRMAVVDGADGNTYQTERAVMDVTATQNFTVVAATAITGLTWPLAAGKRYRIRLRLFGLPNGTIGSTHTLAVTYGGTTTQVALNHRCFQAQSANGIQQTATFNITAIGSLGASPTHVAFNCWHEVDGFITTNAAGTLGFTIALGVAGDDYEIFAGSFLEVLPVT